MYVDDVMIRVFQNHENEGQAYPNSQSVGVYSSSFEASSWVTQGGKVPIDYSQAPFVSSYSNYGIDSCVFEATSPTACSNPPAGTPLEQQIATTRSCHHWNSCLKTLLH